MHRPLFLFVSVSLPLVVAVQGLFVSPRSPTLTVVCNNPVASFGVGRSVVGGFWTRQTSIRSSSECSATNTPVTGDEVRTEQHQISGGDNKAMQFLKKIGRVGGNQKVDFTNAIGVDEGSSTKTAGKWGSGSSSRPLKKSKAAYLSCIQSGTIDDMSEEFPATSSGTQWDGVTDRVMGGASSGTISREEFHGKKCNVLRAHVCLDNNGGFVQMATDLALDPSIRNTVDASSYRGIEMEVLFVGESEKEQFNVHLKNSNCLRQFSSYRATFELSSGKWTTVRLPWASFRGHGWGAVENALDVSTLRRLGVVAIGKAMDVTIALSSVRFFQEPLSPRPSSVP